MESRDLLFLRNYCINLNEIAFIKQAEIGGISELTFYFKDGKGLTVNEVGISDIFHSLEISKKEVEIICLCLLQVLYQI